MAILLTGGTGYIGSHTAVALLNEGRRIVVLDNLSNSSADVIERIESVAGAAVPFVNADVRDTGKVTQALVDHRCNAVMHFAGLKSISESVVEPIRYFDNNVSGTFSLLKAMGEAGVSRLVFSSSATVYGNPVRLPVDETHSTSALNPYGRSKLHVEECLADLCKANPAWEIACLRYFNPAGAHGSGVLGEDLSHDPTNLVPHLAKVALGDLSMLNIFGQDYPTKDGTGVRDYIHVVDLAEGHVKALDFLDGRAGWHAFNLGTGRGYSVLEVLRAFERACGRTIPYRMASKRIGDAASVYADPSIAFDLLKWRPKYDLDDICMSGWRWFGRGRFASDLPTALTPEASRFNAEPD